MDDASRGLMPCWWNDILAPELPWWRPRRKDRRLFPIRGGGREMHHPYMPRIVYPRLPDRTLNFGYDVVPRMRSVLTKTLASTAITKFKDKVEDVVIREIWLADQASTFTTFFHAVQSYMLGTLPPDRYVGWMPRDLSPKAYFVELLDVSLGSGEDLSIEEIGHRTPFVMREAMTISFKCIREIFAPAGVVVGEGL
jgi:hypothetical protein